MHETTKMNVTHSKNDFNCGHEFHLPEERPTFDIIIEESKKELFKKFMNAKKEDVEKYMRFLNGVEEPKKTDKSPRTSQSPRSLTRKIRILTMKAESGDAKAQFSLGTCYSLGEGVIQDKKKAFEYYMMAAEQGYSKAQHLVASSYSYGKGTEQDQNKAFEFYLKAAEQGYDKAQFAVGHFYEYGRGGVGPDHNLALEWYKKAAAQGHKSAKEALEIENEQ